MSDTATDWQEQAAALRRDHAMSTAEIAERFGKSASQVRRVLSAANTAKAINGAPEANDYDPMPGQTTVDDHLAEEPNDYDREDVVDAPWDGARAHSEGDRGDVDPGDDPEHPDTLAEFRAQAGEAVGPMPPTTPAEPGVVETRLAGTRQMALDFGENADTPVGGTLKLKSDKLASGFYGLGDVVTGTFTARIVDVAGAERFQRASEEFRVQPQGHVALITEISLNVGGAA